MTVWIAVLRAVNVGGHNIVPMEALRGVLTKAGLVAVKTYIQSGNIVFRSDRPRFDLAPLIADAIHASFGFRPPVLILAPDELDRALSGHPFAKAVSDPTKLHFFFIDRVLPDATAAFLKSVAAPGEGYAFRGKVLWLHLPDGSARSKLATRVMALPMDITARNLRTVQALQVLAQKIAAAKS
jgi:uncharacterized protein (DUF1697 family)